MYLVPACSGYGGSGLTIDYCIKITYRIFTHTIQIADIEALNGVGDKKNSSCLQGGQKRQPLFFEACFPCRWWQ